MPKDWENKLKEFYERVYDSWENLDKFNNPDLELFRLLRNLEKDLENINYHNLRIQELMKK